MKNTGKIDVKTENIFPIIKQFLYTDQEIFLREIISNAMDATTKLKILASQGDIKEDLGDLTIEVIPDEKKKTITVKDKGVGMTEEEINKYINQIAFSSAEDFIKQFKNKSDAEKSGLIGYFGLGFYSAFMVSEKVEIKTKTYKKGAGTKAVKWSCEGNPEFTIEETDKKDRGTEIILHIGKDAKEYLEEYKLLELLKKYCRFLPVPIRFGDITEKVKKEGEKDKNGKDVYEDITKPRIINNTEPLWKKPPQDLKEENYMDFYRELYPASFEKPLFNIHINVDYPFDLTGILYFPKLKKNYEVNRDKIQLYCNQVFITDSVENIVPDFLTLLHGVIDSPDIPLNVSRSALQTDSNVRKISAHITKKVADKLEDLFKNNRENYQKKWDDIKIFIEYGFISEPKFKERAKKFCLLKNTKNEYYTIDEYRDLIKKNQTDKDKKIVVLYTTDETSQYTYTDKVISYGYDVLLMDSFIDSHFINNLEQEEKLIFKRVDSDVLEKLIQKKDDDATKTDLTEDEQKQLKELFDAYVKDDKTFYLEFENVGDNEAPIVITQPEFMRRMKEMSNAGGMEYMENMPETYNIVVNTSNSQIRNLAHTDEKEKASKTSSQLLDLALLSHGLLKGEKLKTFINRSYDLLE